MSSKVVDVFILFMQSIELEKEEGDSLVVMCFLIIIKGRVTERKIVHEKVIRGWFR